MTHPTPNLTDLRPCLSRKSQRIVITNRKSIRSILKSLKLTHINNNDNKHLWRHSDGTEVAECGYYAHDTRQMKVGRRTSADVGRFSVSHDLFCRSILSSAWCLQNNRFVRGWSRWYLLTARPHCLQCRRCFSHCNSVRPSVCHTLVPYPDEWR